MSAMAAYEKSRIELDRAVGTLLDHQGISIDDAAQGRSPTCPTFPRLRPARTAFRRNRSTAAQPTAIDLRIRFLAEAGAASSRGSLFFPPHNSLQTHNVSLNFLPLR